MLSRVADSLYWMSRYFERADHCARVLEANYNLMLNPSKPWREKRWQSVTAALGLSSDAAGPDPQTSILRFIGEADNRSSIVCCITSARENASQVREEISSEMWERLNQIYHQVTQATQRNGTDSEPLRLITALREGAYRFQGVTDATMNHGEGWHFIQFGKYMERACDLSKLLDAQFAVSAGADDLDWVGLLSSCSAYEAYLKVYTADLVANRVAEFLLLNPEFPYSVRHSVERMKNALDSIAEISSARKASIINRVIGRLRSSLAYIEIDEIVSSDLHKFLHGILEQCQNLHGTVHEVYIKYPVESAFEA